ncbi:MAG TPA: DUF2070 family protein [Sulfolobales archaeon]|nr:DUF2070 family protein [Sulfolobales archaeon]
MEQGSAEDLVNRMYRKLFYLPKITFLSIVYVLEGFVIALSGSSSYRISPHIFISALFGLAVYLFLIYLFFVIGGVVDSAKKSLGIAVFSLAPYIIVDFIAAGKERLFLSFSASSGMVFLIHYIFKGMLFRSFGVAIATSLATSMASIYLFSHLLGQGAGKSISLSSEAPVLIISSLVSIVVFAIFIAILELGGRVGGLRTFEVARGFLRSWLFGENEILEKAFYRNAVKDTMRIRVLSIYRDGGKPIHLIYPGFHYGPFKKVGSADAVYIIDKYIESLGAASLVFHTIGSHERNVVLRSSVERIAEDLARRLSTTMESDSRDNIVGPIRISRDSWSCLAIGSDRCTAVYISNADGADDLPESVEKVLLGVEKAKGIMISVADSHSNYGRNRINEDVIAEMVVEAIDKLRDARGPSMVGYGEYHMKGKLCRGLCSGRVKALVIRNGRGDSAVIYLYGNNMLKSARESIIKAVKSMGFADVEVVTPDDHSCAAESLGTAYTAIHPCQELVGAAVAAVNEALKDLKPARTACSEHSWEDIPFMGGAVQSYLKALEALGPLTSKLWIITLALSIAVVTITVTLIF